MGPCSEIPNLAPKTNSSPRKPKTLFGALGCSLVCSLSGLGPGSLFITLSPKPCRAVRSLGSGVLGFRASGLLDRLKGVCWLCWFMVLLVGFRPFGLLACGILWANQALGLLSYWGLRLLVFTICFMPFRLGLRKGLGHFLARASQKQPV